MEEKLHKLAKHIKQMEDNIKTEEATKHSCILPFLQLLNFNPYNLKEVIPEYTADVRDKNNDKVDYALVVNGEPQIFIEAKNFNKSLTDYIGQLKSYFVSNINCKLGVLTNGIEYQFFTDFEHKNIMDNEPFFVFNLYNYTNEDIEKLKLFVNNDTNYENVILEVIYRTKVENFINENKQAPSDSFVKFIAKQFIAKPSKTDFNILKPIIKEALCNDSNTNNKNEQTTNLDDKDFKTDLQEEEINFENSNKIDLQKRYSLKEINDILKQFNYPSYMKMTNNTNCFNAFSYLIDKLNEIYESPTFNITQNYINIFSNNILCASIIFNNNSIKLELKADYKQYLNDEKVEILINIGHLGNGDIRLTIFNKEDVDQCIPYIKNCYQDIL